MRFRVRVRVRVRGFRVRSEGEGKGIGTARTTFGNENLRAVETWNGLVKA